MSLKVSNDAVAQALAGNKGFTETTNFKGEAAFAAFNVAEIYGTRWAVIAKIDSVEANGPITSLMIQFLVVGALVVAGAALIGFLVARSITAPLTSMLPVSRSLISRS